VLTAAEARVRRPPQPNGAPALGADTDAVLEEAGIDAFARARLRADGVV
jgi:crotonobetainyl-CoA:carnitine CoA-transferase CaiB-like acyl-CoA transferase